MVQMPGSPYGVTSAKSARTDNRGQDDPATAEVTAILLGYLMLGEKSPAQEIIGAPVIGRALLLQICRKRREWTTQRGHHRCQR